MYINGFIQKGYKSIIYKIAIEAVLADELYFEKPILESIPDSFFYLSLCSKNYRKSKVKF
jgi:hypothetical protein